MTDKPNSDVVIRLIAAAAVGASLSVAVVGTALARPMDLSISRPTASVAERLAAIRSAAADASQRTSMSLHEAFSNASFSNAAFSKGVVVLE